MCMLSKAEKELMLTGIKNNSINYAPQLSRVNLHVFTAKLGNEIAVISLFITQKNDVKEITGIVYGSLMNEKQELHSLTQILEDVFVFINPDELPDIAHQILEKLIDFKKKSVVPF